MPFTLTQLTIVSNQNVNPGEYSLAHTSIILLRPKQAVHNDDRILRQVRRPRPLRRYRRLMEGIRKPDMLAWICLRCVK
jgi:hypothetical protein